MKLKFKATSRLKKYMLCFFTDFFPPKLSRCQLILPKNETFLALFIIYFLQNQKPRIFVLCKQCLTNVKIEIFSYIILGVYEEELTEETCPICEKDYPPEQLPIHAQTCAQQWFD